MLLLVIDNYDSFTHNLVQMFGGLGADLMVRRNDTITAGAALKQRPDAIVLSPGPGTPDHAGVCIELIGRAYGIVPLLGVCLGHQCLAQFWGARVNRGSPLHGQTSLLEHDGSDLFEGVPNRCEVARYHSLVVDETTLPDTVAVTAHADGVVMAISNRLNAAYGIQFHPESFMTPFGTQMASNFMEIAASWNSSPTR